MSDYSPRICQPGCTCGRHTRPVCEPGCACYRHRSKKGLNAGIPKRKCEPGCTCGKHAKDACRPGCTCWRHRTQTCAPGCVCKRHTRSGRTPRVLTDPEKEAARLARNAYQVEYARKRKAADPGYRPASREQERRYQMKYHYGLTPVGYDSMVLGQEGRCYLCTGPLQGLIHVDHDHGCCPGERTCGKCVRGLACNKCNKGIGMFGDDPDLMIRAAENLRSAQERMRARNA